MQVIEIVKCAKDFFEHPINTILDSESYELSGKYSSEDEGELLTVLNSLEKKLEEGHMNKKNINAITVAVSEVIENAKEHTLSWDPNSKIYLETTITDTYDFIAITSEGKEFKLSKVKELLKKEFNILEAYAKMKEHPESRKDLLRGNGWTFIKNNADVIIYSGYFNEKTEKYHTGIILGKYKN